MRKFLTVLLTVVFTLSFATCGYAQQSTDASPEGALPLSQHSIRVTSGDLTAVFQLYDTQAATSLYEQLPLELELHNFANAQWMFYPPEELPVTSAEVYRDGLKGELSYYEPWGDAFMLYEDFHSGDDMYRLGVCTEGIDNIADMSGVAIIEQADSLQAQEGVETMQISITTDEATIVYELNDSQAAKDLYAQLPLFLTVEDFSNNEKIFYPTDSLNTSDAPVAQGGAGVLAYYAPWGDVVMFYAGFGANGSLYELGHAITGVENISGLSGNITIEAVQE